jgi:hypothetical protein
MVLDGDAAARGAEGRFVLPERHSCDRRNPGASIANARAQRRPDQ